MSVAETIEETIRRALAPSHLAVVNESDRHAVPPGSESHFKLVVVSAAFVGQSRIARHRMVSRLIGEVLAAPLHALALETFTPAEWTARQGRTAASPPCLGGGRGTRPGDLS